MPSVVFLLFYLTETVKVNVFAGGTLSQGRLYPIEMVLLPFWSALKIHASAPGAPTRGEPPLVTSGGKVINFWSTFSNTVWSLMFANSHWKPVVWLDSRITVNEPPAAILTSLPEYEESTVTCIGVDDEPQANRANKVADIMMIRIILISWFPLPKVQLHLRL